MTNVEEPYYISSLMRMSDLDLGGHRVLIRSDLNAPLRDGKVSDDARIRSCLLGVRQALEAGAAVLLVSHLGRPEGVGDRQSHSLAPVAARLSEMLERPVPLQQDWLAGVKVEPGEIVVCENVRFYPGETCNEEEFAREMAALCRVFVNDAFAVCHRKHASVHGIVKYVPASCAGPLLLSELEHLSRLLEEEPARPLVAVVGGAKPGTKLGAMRRLLTRADQLIPGGGIANALLRASGRRIGTSSPSDEDSLHLAERLLAQPQADRIIFPQDVVCAKAVRPDAQPRLRSIDAIPEDEAILDLGPESCERICDLLRQAGTIVWSGPVGMFEYEPFRAGTYAIARAIAASEAYSVAGGGETRAAISAAGADAGFSYLSTGGGAFLRYLEGNSLPAIAMLAEAAAAWRAMERGRDL